MYASDAVTKIIEELEFLEAEQRRMRERGPHFRIVHRHSELLAPCGPHEEIAAVYLVHAGKAIQVRFGTTHSILFDYMARHNRLAQTARQIERGTRAEFGYGHRGNHRAHHDLQSGIPRRHVRVHMDRIRVALAISLEEAGLDVEVYAVLISENTATNELAYRLRGTFEWLHPGP